MTLHRLLALMLVVGLIAAACGSGEDDEGAGGDGDSAATAETDIDDGDAQENAGPTEDDAEDPPTTDEDDGDEPPSGDSGSAWCNAVREAQENPDDSPLSFDFFGKTPAQIEEQFNKNVEVIEDWADLAPNEIKGDVETIAAAFRRFVQFGNEADWDVIALSENPEFATAFDDPGIDQAGDRLDQYSRTVCGVDLNAGLDAGPSDQPPVPEVSEDALLIDQLFEALGVGAAGFIPDEIKVCMNAQLLASGAFPDGIGTGFTVTEEAFAVLDAAATACGFEDF